MGRNLAVCLLFWLAGGAAQAAGPGDIEEAKARYQAGAVYYEAGSYDEAIREFNEAYRLSKAPALLYNLSQAYDKKRDIPHAREYLKRYIDSGGAEPGELPELQEKLRAYDQQLKAVKPAPPPAPPPAEKKPEKKPEPVRAPPEAVAPPSPSPAEPGPPFRVWKWVTGGAGVAFVATSIAFMADAKSQQNKIEDAQGRGLPYSPDLQDAYSRGQRDNALAIVFGVAGGALIATSVVMFVVDGGKKHATGERARFVPSVSPAGAGGAVVWDF